jgi:esterase/lipase superfamily enzyme
VIFIHGNRYDSASAKSQGLQLARRLTACRTGEPQARTVIFSWPSAQEGQLLRDSRAKYERSMTEGHYLAWLLGQVEPSRPVAIVAYSYGGLIALEALDNLVSAQRSGRADLQPWTDRPARMHLVLVAAAVRQDALAPCGEYRSVLRCIDRLTLLNNTRDQALRFFEFVDPDLRTEALGHENMPARWLPPEIEFVQVDAASVVGKSHRFPPYVESPSLRQRLVAGTLDGLAGD